MICSRCHTREADPGYKTCTKCREWNQKDKQKLVDRGLCSQCRKNPVSPGQWKCPECLAKYNARNQGKRDSAFANGICTKCRKNPAVPGGRYCESCREKNKQSENEAYAWCKKHGICTRCRVNKAAPGYSKCIDCLNKTYVTAKKYENGTYYEKRKKMDREWKAKRTQEAREKGLCYICWKNPATPGMKSCGACRVKQNEKRRKQCEKRARPDAAILFIQRSGK